jgi:four helix bundle protein
MRREGRKRYYKRKLKVHSCQLTGKQKMSTSFEDLVVWKRSCLVAVNLYNWMKNSKDFFLRDQMLQAAISIPSNIAEGSERDSIPEFKRFLAFAKGSAAELRTQVYIARKIGSLDTDDANSTIVELKEISRMLQGLLNSLGKSKRNSKRPS